MIHKNENEKKNAQGQREKYIISFKCIWMSFSALKKCQIHQNIVYNISITGKLKVLKKKMQTKHKINEVLDL